MIKKILKFYVQSYDYSLIILPFLLIMFGLVMVYSASMVFGPTEFDVESSFFFKRQFIWAIASIAAFIGALLLPYKAYFSMFKYIAIGTVILLVAVLIFGRVAGNARSWIQVFGFNIQPAEVAKLGIIIYLAGIFSKKQAYIEKFSQAVIPPLIFTLGVFMLVFIQPDLGTGMIILGIAATVVLCSGMRPKHLFGLIGLGAAGIAGLITLFISENQSSRFVAAYDPFSRPSGEGYQLINSYLAIGHGGLTGQGLGQSIQKYGYLPEPHTDFILAIISEELGIFGVGFVIISIAYIVLKGLSIARRIDDTFGSLLAVGISGMIGIQAVVNIGALTGLLPVTGVPLPFISYGGSSLVLLMISMGILVNISSFANQQRKKERQHDTHISSTV
ncbi:FtsW/RodA/SpoVE family cell cycle protein [Bacillus marinisedimentorum]|uniref:FtsW/RodA/SpoVE family cell cycle protein n=1 Tax=Bacillus marinisedimentorum TaxID=1821260 RepID=UPI0007E2919B|nr:FtsW/RodA/SpoVE family cell cycle protein [Bacillus marinisedimentorum]